MITKYDNYGAGCSSYDMYGLSTDEKPTDVANASTFYEMDTATLYMFDAQNGVWLAQ
jgi:hypothetical protein